MNYDAELKVSYFSDHDIDDKLRNMYPDLPAGDSYRAAHGTIYTDIKGRFADGDWVRTSWIVEETDEYIKTRNTLYKKR